MESQAVESPEGRAPEPKRVSILPWVGFVIFVGLGLSLFVVAAVRSGLLHFGSTPITDMQVKVISALPASLIAGAITLAGILLTDAHNRRTHQLAIDAEENRKRLAHEEDRRVRLEFVSRSIDLLTEGQDYAKRAQVAGAIATIVNLGYTSVALKTLEPSWSEGAIDANAATWLIDQAIAAGDPHQISDASTILLEHAHELARKTDLGIALYLPDRLLGEWDSDWPPYAKFSFIGTLTRAIISLAPSDWSYENRVFLTLWKASKDSDEATRRMAAAVLYAFVQTPENLSLVFGHGTDAFSKATTELTRLRLEGVGPNWFFRTPLLIAEIERWHQGVAEWSASWKAHGAVTRGAGTSDAGAGALDTGTPDTVTLLYSVAVQAKRGGTGSPDTASGLGGAEGI